MLTSSIKHVIWAQNCQIRKFPAYYIHRKARKTIYACVYNRMFCGWRKRIEVENPCKVKSVGVGKQPERAVQQSYQP